MTNILSNPEEFEEEITLNEKLENEAIDFNWFFVKNKWTRVNDKQSDKFGLYYRNAPRLAECSFFTTREIYKLFKSEQGENDYEY